MIPCQIFSIFIVNLSLHNIEKSFWNNYTMMRNLEMLCNFCTIYILVGKYCATLASFTSWLEVLCNFCTIYILVGKYCATLASFTSWLEVLCNSCIIYIWLGDVVQPLHHLHPGWKVLHNTCIINFLVAKCFINVVQVLNH